MVNESGMTKLKAEPERGQNFDQERSEDDCPLPRTRQMPAISAIIGRAGTVAAARRLSIVLALRASVAPPRRWRGHYWTITNVGATLTYIPCAQSTPRAAAQRFASIWDQARISPRTASRALLF